MENIFIPYIKLKDASVENIINILQDAEIGIVEYVNLIGKKDFDGNYYYEAHVCFAHIYNNDIGSYVKQIALYGGIYTVTSGHSKFVLLQGTKAIPSERDILDLKRRIHVLEGRISENNLVSGDALLKRKHRWAKYSII